MSLLSLSMFKQFRSTTVQINLLPACNLLPVWKYIWLPVFKYICCQCLNKFFVRPVWNILVAKFWVYLLPENRRICCLARVLVNLMKPLRICTLCGQMSDLVWDFSDLPLFQTFTYWREKKLTFSLESVCA